MDFSWLGFAFSKIFSTLSNTTAKNNNFKLFHKKLEAKGSYISLKNLLVREYRNLTVEYIVKVLLFFKNKKNNNRSRVDR